MMSKMDQYFYLRKLNIQKGIKPDLCLQQQKDSDSSGQEGESTHTAAAEEEKY